MLALSCALLLTSATSAPEVTAAAPRPEITIQSVEVPGIAVRYLTIPWGPSTMATLEAPGDSPLNRRAWAFARMETSRTLTIEGTRLSPANYALVFLPNDSGNRGVQLEIRRVAAGEFLEAGNAMGPAPEGERVFQTPIHLETAARTAAALRIDLLSAGKRTLVQIHYGDRRLVKALEH